MHTRSEVSFKWALTTLFTNMRTLKFKSCLHNCVFRCRQSLRSQATNLETCTNDKSHTWPFEPAEVKFCFLIKRSAKMTDGSEKRNHQFEFHDSHAFEKRSNSSALASRMSLCRKHGFTLVDKVHYLMYKLSSCPLSRKNYLPSP